MTRLNLTPRAEWAPVAQRREEPSPCARGCCWSPYGHSTVRDIFPTWHAEACKCHTETKGNEK